MAAGRRRTAMVALVLLLVAAGCGPDPVGDGGTPSFGDESLSGMCESVDVDFAEDAEGHADEQAAYEAFVRTNSVLERTSARDGTIFLGDEVVGTLELTEVPRGGFLVTSARWCYP